MPSPCEVVDPTPAIALDLPMVLPEKRALAGRVIPAAVGGVFAGLMLVGLGCTPFFSGQTQQRVAEQPIIVGGPVKVATARTQTPASSAAGAEVVLASGGAASPAVASPTGAATSTSAGSAGSGAPALAAASAKRDGASTSGAAHGFVVLCTPPHEGVEDERAPRPETTALQGIMAGQNSRTALLDGVLYREGDHFGSAVCPWTVAMIEPHSVRIEKAFGDRTCGITIRFQSERSPSSRTRPRSSVASVTSR